MGPSFVALLVYIDDITLQEIYNLDDIILQEINNLPTDNSIGNIKNSVSN